MLENARSKKNMLDFNFEKNCKKSCKIYFVAAILIPETRYKQGELSIALIAA